MKNYFSSIKEKAIRHKILVQNFSYLSILQIFNMLIPLITYPYLIRVVGKETYGLVVFAQAVIAYLVILVGFGFNISATKEVSIHRDNKEKLNEIVSSVLIIKALFLILSFLLLVALLFFIPKAHGYKALFLLSMWACIYEVIFPTWYFQGIERMKYITYITIVSRIIFLGLIFVFIHAPSDYLFIPIINGIGALTAGIISLYIIFSKHCLSFRIQQIPTLKYYFKDSIPIFVSNVSVKLYVSTNKVIVGAFLGMAEVTYYDLAEKITTVLKIPQSILSQSLFPKISKERNIKFIKKIFNYSLMLNIGLFVIILIFSKFIILILGGQHLLPAQTIVNVLTLTVPIIAMSNIFGVQLLIPFGFQKSFSRVILTSGIVYLIQLILVWLTMGFTLINVTILTLTTEIFVTAYMFYFCKKYKLWK